MNEKDFRICLDVTTIDTIPFNYVWYNVKPCKLKTVADLKISIVEKFDLTNESISLFLNSGVVLDEEDVTIFRENDTVKLLHKAEQLLPFSNTSLNLKKNKKDENCESVLDGSFSNPNKAKHRSRRSSHKDEKYLPIRPFLNLELDKKGKYYEHMQNDGEAFQTPKKPKCTNIKDKYEHMQNDGEAFQIPKKPKCTNIKDKYEHMQIDGETFQIIKKPKCTKSYIESFKIQEAEIKNCEKTSMQNETKNVSEQNLKTSYEDSDSILLKINADDSTFTNDFASNCNNEVPMQENNPETSSKKRKRKRHRKRKSNMTNDSSFSNLMNDSISTPETKVAEIPVNDGYAAVRKHVKYECSLENPLTVLNQYDAPTVVQSDSDDPSSSDEKIKNICSKITFLKPSPTNLMHKKTEIKEAAQSTPKKKVYLEEKDAAVIEMGNDVPMIPNNTYENCPDIKSVPEIGTKIAFKVLELNEHYCPELTDYKVGTVINVNRDTEDVVVKLQTAEVKQARIGKFENIHENDEIPSSEVVNEVVRRWCDFIQPRRL